MRHLIDRLRFAWWAFWYAQAIDDYRRSACPGDDPDEIFTALPRLRDKCQMCYGNMGGVYGNEQIVRGVIMCDYCEAIESYGDAA